MVERVCPECQHGNPLENRFCGRCGSALERQLSVSASENGATQSTAITVAGHTLPVTWKQVGQTVAVGLTALVAEAGMAWLRRKVEHVAMPHASTATPPSTAIVPTRTASQGSANDTVTIVSQRVLEVWERGKMKQQVVERSFWRKEP